MVRRRRANNSALSYLGVSAAAPPEVIIKDERDPTQNDTDFEVSTLWLRTDTSNLRIFMLLSKDQGFATWVQVYPVATAAGAQNFITQNGVATADNGDINVDAGLGLQTRASGLHTFTIEPDTANTGNVFLSGVGFGPVTSPDGSINVNFTPARLELTVSNAIASGVQQLRDELGNIASPNNNNVIDILGGVNIETQQDPNAIRIETRDSIDLPATSGITTGTYQIDSNPVLHTFPSAGTVNARNLFVGTNAGNFTQNANNINNVGVGSGVLLNITQAQSNTAMGTRALNASTTGAGNVAMGFRSGASVDSASNNTMIGTDSMRLLVTGTGNVALGQNSLFRLQSGTENVALGFRAGREYGGSETKNLVIKNEGVAAESNTIRIGNPTDHNRAFMHGIYNVTQTQTDLQYVTINSSGQLGATDYSGAEGVATNETRVLAHLENDLSIPATSGGIRPGTSSSYVLLGATQALVEDRDDGDDFFPGDGAGNEATFTVPRTGNYSFHVSLYNATTPVSVTGGVEYSMPQLQAYKNTIAEANAIIFAGETVLVTGQSASVIQRFSSLASAPGDAEIGRPLVAGDVIKFIVGLGGSRGNSPALGGGQDLTGSSIWRTQIAIRENWSTGLT